MAYTIAVTALKGGVGKSTIVANLGVCYHEAGRRVLLVDTDVQGTLGDWAAVASRAEVEGPPVAAIKSDAIARDLPKLARGYDVVLIDCPARLGKESVAALKAADLVLLPALPGPADVWALRQTLTVVEEVQAVRGHLEARIVLNRMDARTTMAEQARDIIAEAGVKVLAELGNRVAFAEALLTGRGVTTYEPSSVAAEEMLELFKRLTSLERRKHVSVA